MTLKTDLDDAVEKIFREIWTVTGATVVPDSSSLTLSNTGKTLDGAVLYADLAASTKLVDNQRREFAAEIYKTFLLVAARIIRASNGTITAYDGDRIMAVFIGATPASDAVKAALMINWACKNIIQPKLDAQYPLMNYKLAHTCGIDYSPLMAAKTGVRGANDLVWVGKAANYAAKLSSLDSATPTWITANAYNRLADWATHGGDPRRNMWEARYWTPMDNQLIYCSHWHWSFL